MECRQKWLSNTRECWKREAVQFLLKGRKERRFRHVDLLKA